MLCKDKANTSSLGGARLQHNGRSYRQVSELSVKREGLPCDVVSSHDCKCFSRDWMILAPDILKEILRY